MTNAFMLGVKMGLVLVALIAAYALYLVVDGGGIGRERLFRPSTISVIVLQEAMKFQPMNQVQ